MGLAPQYLITDEYIGKLGLDNKISQLHSLNMEIAI